LVDYVTQEEMETYVAAQGFTTVPNTVSSIVNTVDNWYELLLDILNRINNEVNEVNGENVVGTIVDRFEYLIETKRLIKDKIQQYVDMPDYTPFRNYPYWIGKLYHNNIIRNVVITKKIVPKVIIDNELTVKLPIIYKSVIITKGIVKNLPILLDINNNAIITVNVSK
jgi:hypothetical protein